MPLRVALLIVGSPPDKLQPGSHWRPPLELSLLRDHLWRLGYDSVICIHDKHAIALADRKTSKVQIPPIIEDEIYKGKIASRLETLMDFLKTIITSGSILFVYTYGYAFKFGSSLQMSFNSVCSEEDPNDSGIEDDWLGIEELKSKLRAACRGWKCATYLLLDVYSEEDLMWDPSVMPSRLSYYRAIDSQHDDSAEPDNFAWVAPAFGSNHRDMTGKMGSFSVFCNSFLNALEEVRQRCRGNVTFSDFVYIMQRDLSSVNTLRQGEAADDDALIISLGKSEGIEPLIVSSSINVVHSYISKCSVPVSDTLQTDFLSAIAGSMAENCGASQATGHCVMPDFTVRISCPACPDSTFGERVWEASRALQRQCKDSELPIPEVKKVENLGIEHRTRQAPMGELEYVVSVGEVSFSLQSLADFVILRDKVILKTPEVEFYWRGPPSERIPERKSSLRSVITSGSGRSQSIVEAGQLPTSWMHGFTIDDTRLYIQLHMVGHMVSLLTMQIFFGLPEKKESVRIEKCWVVSDIASDNQEDDAPPAKFNARTYQVLGPDDKRDGEHAGTLEGHRYWVKCADCSSDELVLATGSADRTVILWDLKTKTQSAVLRGHAHGITVVIFSPFTIDRRKISSLEVPVTSSDSSSDEEMPTEYACSSPNQAYRRGDALTMSKQFMADREAKSVKRRKSADSRDVALIATASSDGEVFLWNSSTGAKLHELLGHDGSVRGLSFSSKSEVLASAGDDRVIRIFDAVSGTCLNVLHGHMGAISCLKFVHRKEDILGSSCLDGSIHLWRVILDDQAKSTVSVRDMRMHRRSNPSVEDLDTADGKSVASSRGDFLLVRSRTPGARKARGKQLFFPSSRSVASEHGVQGVRASISLEPSFETSLNLHVLKAHTDSVECIDFSRSDSLLVSCGRDGRVIIWKFADDWSTVQITSVFHCSDLLCSPFFCEEEQEEPRFVASVAFGIADDVLAISDNIQNYGAIRIGNSVQSPIQRNFVTLKSDQLLRVQSESKFESILVQSLSKRVSQCLFGKRSNVMICSSYDTCVHLVHCRHGGPVAFGASEHASGDRSQLARSLRRMSAEHSSLPQLSDSRPNSRGLNVRDSGFAEFHRSHLPL